MPSHEVHRLLAKLLLGKEHPDVDFFLDWPWIFYRGKHREVWGHDPKALIYTYLASGGNFEKVIAAALHILADKYVDKKIEKLLRLIAKLKKKKGK